MSITKQCIITSPNIYESSAMNYVKQSQIGTSFIYTPSTGINSCIEGYTIDFSNCTTGEKIYIRLKVEWNGFDTSNTNGDFSMWFQGDTYHVTNGWEWAGNPVVAAALSYTSNLKNLVLSSTSGSTILKTSTTIHSDYPSVRKYAHMGIRTDYSNGTGWIRISELEVIPEKYYVPETFAGEVGASLHIGKDYISAGEIYEI